MLDKRKGPGAGGAEDPSKDDSAARRSNSEKADGSKVPSDCHEATDFLERLRPGGPWVLTAIDPTAGKIETLTAHNASEVLDFVRAHDGKRNIYYLGQSDADGNYQKGDEDRYRRDRISRLPISIRGTTRARRTRRRATLKPWRRSSLPPLPSSTAATVFKLVEAGDADRAGRAGGETFSAEDAAKIDDVEARYRR